MPKLTSVEDLKKLRQQLQGEIKTRTDTTTTVIVGMGTCGISAGARETMHAILEELDRRGISAHVTTVGCIGMCAKEPLVDIRQGNGPRITYGNVTPKMVPRLIEEHIVNGHVVDEWAIGRIETA